MTIVMEEDGFNTSLSSLSSLSSQTNYQTLTSNGQSANNRNSYEIFQKQPQSNSPPSSNNQEICGAHALFLFRSNSSLEMFEERKINLDKPCKIGRSVAKIKPEPHNAIFDCKVLSRNHALLWHENSKFFIQDTKSSNGTFLNGNRLGKSNEDSAPYDLTSGDIIQFGVDVTENTKKVTHGCITVEIKLFHKPGVEASVYKPNQVAQSNKIDVQTQELYQLALFLQEAMMREEVLNQKLISLQSFVEQAKETSDNGWLTLIDEDRLLSRIDLLEKQANLHNKNHTEDSLQNTLSNLISEKFNVENTAKLAIQKMIEEKNETLQKYDELKAVYNLRDDEFVAQQKVLDDAKISLLDLAGKYQELLNEMQECQENGKEMEQKNQEGLAQLNSEKSRYEILSEDASNVERTLNAKIESLIAEKDFTSKRLEGVLNKIERNNIDLIIENGAEKVEVIEDKEVEVNGDESVSENTNTVEVMKDEICIKSEQVCQNGFPPEMNDHLLGQDRVINDLEKSDSKEKPNEYYQQELELQKIMNDNLLVEIERLRGILSSPQTYDEDNKSFNSETASPQKINRSITHDIVQPQIINDDSTEFTDLKHEYKFIKNKILQIETQTKDLFKSGSSNELNEGLINQVNSIEQSFRRIHQVRQLIDTKNINVNQTEVVAQNEPIKSCESTLQAKLDKMERDYESMEVKLVDSENTVDTLNTALNDVSLQVKIVSYFSAFPLLILILAILISLYPLLATITATDI